MEVAKMVNSTVARKIKIHINSKVINYVSL